MIKCKACFVILGIAILWLAGCGGGGSVGDNLRFGDGTDATWLTDGRVSIIAALQMETGEWPEGDELCVRAAWYAPEARENFFGASNGEGTEPERIFETKWCTIEGIPSGEILTVEFETEEVIPTTANEDYYFVLWIESDAGGGANWWVQMVVF